METANAFNNAGVDCFERGQVRVAWDLFKGALEVKLSTEKTGNTPLLDAPDDAYAALVKENVYVYRADYHFRHLADKDLPNESLSSGINSRIRSSQGLPATTEQRLEFDDGHCDPFVFSRSLRIVQPLTAKRPVDENLASATVILNLAMVEHIYGTRKPTDTQHSLGGSAMALYRLASSLITGGDEFATIALALMNNISCLYYERNQQQASQRCMEVVARLLQRRSMRDPKAPVVNAQENASLMSNVIWILNPPHAASPAA